MSGDVRFVRIRGRIVPIRSKSSQDTKRAALVKGGAATVGGAYFGGNFALGTQAPRLNRITRTLKKIQNFEPQVDSRAFTKSTGIKARVITTAADAEASTRPLGKRISIFMGRAHGPMTHQGGGATISHKKVGNLVFTRDFTSPSILAHELGHVRDFEKVGSPKFWQRGFLGRLTGAELRMEKRAWNLAPSIKSTLGRKGGMVQFTGIARTRTIKKLALGTYQIVQRATRVGAGIGAGVGLAYGIHAYRNARSGK